MKTIKIISDVIIAAGLFSYHFAPAQINEEAKPLIDKVGYKNAIGLRSGETFGLTFKHFFKEYRVFEGILGAWPNACSFTGLYEKHQTAFKVEGMKWYYGGGGHVSFMNDRTYYIYNERNGYFYRYRYGSNPRIGIDGILGLEYKINPIPFAISLDMKPFIEVVSDGGLYAAIDFSVGIKLTF